jgi:hypothetical protein
MPDRTWFIAPFPSPLIFRYHLPLKHFSGPVQVHNFNFVGTFAFFLRSDFDGSAKSWRALLLKKKY